MNIDDIITLKNNKEYIIIDKETFNNNEYLLVDEVDKNENLLDNYQILKVNNTNNKLTINIVKDETELTNLKIIFYKKLYEEG